VPRTKAHHGWFGLLARLQFPFKFPHQA